MALSKCVLNSDKLGSLFQCLPVKKGFLMTSLNLSWQKYYVSHCWIPGRKDQHLPFPFPSSANCRELWSHPSASLSPDLTSSGLSGAPGHSFQPHHQLCHLPLDAFKDLHILPRIPELLRVLEVRQHQGWMQWDNHPSGLPGDAGLGEPKGVGCPPGCHGTLLSIRAFAHFPNPAYKAAIWCYFSEF